MENQKVKVGIYTAGSHLRIIGEHDLFEQDYSHREPAIYLVEISMMRDPRNPVSDEEINKYIEAMKANFRDNSFHFKAKNREDADKFINYKIKNGWEPVRELSEV